MSTGRRARTSPAKKRGHHPPDDAQVQAKAVVEHAVKAAQDQKGPTAPDPSEQCQQCGNRIQQKGDSLLSCLICNAFAHKSCLPLQQVYVCKTCCRKHPRKAASLTKSVRIVEPKRPEPVPPPAPPPVVAAPQPKTVKSSASDSQSVKQRKNADPHASVRVGKSSTTKSQDLSKKAGSENSSGAGKKDLSGGQAPVVKVKSGKAQSKRGSAPKSGASTALPSKPKKKSAGKPSPDIFSSVPKTLSPRAMPAASFIMAEAEEDDICPVCDGDCDCKTNSGSRLTPDLQYAPLSQILSPVVLEPLARRGQSQTVSKPSSSATIKLDAGLAATGRSRKNGRDATQSNNPRSRRARLQRETALTENSKKRKRGNTQDDVSESVRGKRPRSTRQSSRSIVKTPSAEEDTLFELFSPSSEEDYDDDDDEDDAPDSFLRSSKQNWRLKSKGTESVRKDLKTADAKQLRNDSAGYEDEMMMDADDFESLFNTSSSSSGSSSAGGMSSDDDVYHTHLLNDDELILSQRMDEEDLLDQLVYTGWSSGDDDDVDDFQFLLDSSISSSEDEDDEDNHSSSDTGVCSTRNMDANTTAISGIANGSENKESLDTESPSSCIDPKLIHPTSTTDRIEQPSVPAPEVRTINVKKTELGPNGELVTRLVTVTMNSHPKSSGSAGNNRKATADGAYKKKQAALMPPPKRPFAFPDAFAELGIQIGAGVGRAANGLPLSLPDSLPANMRLAIQAASASVLKSCGISPLPPSEQSYAYLVSVNPYAAAMAMMAATNPQMFLALGGSKKEEGSSSVPQKAGSDGSHDSSNARTHNKVRRPVDLRISTGSTGKVLPPSPRTPVILEELVNQEEIERASSNMSPFSVAEAQQAAAAVAAAASKDTRKSREGFTVPVGVFRKSRRKQQRTLKQVFDLSTAVRVGRSADSVTLQSAGGGGGRGDQEVEEDGFHACFGIIRQSQQPTSPVRVAESPAIVLTPIFTFRDLDCPVGGDKESFSEIPELVLPGPLTT